MFEIGDRVICIAPSSYEEFNLEAPVGSIHYVTKTGKDFIRLDGHIRGHLPKRFELYTVGKVVDEPSFWLED